MKVPELPRYGAGAALYDVLSCEKAVYRVGRMNAICQLALKTGDRVLDIGCGTGLNFPHLRDRIGTRGSIVGVDASEMMLAQAQKKFQPGDNVSLVHGDAGQLDGLIARRTFDAVIVTYALSIIPGWQHAWASAMRHTRPGGRLAVVDLALPQGVGRLLDPVARLACFTGGVDLGRRPWQLVENDLQDTTTQTHRWGHVVVAVGTHVPVDQELR